MGYITKLDLGTNCGFGSQMSQYASLFAISKKSNNDLILIEESFTNSHFGLLISEPFKTKIKTVSYDKVSNKLFYKVTPHLPPNVLMWEIDKTLFSLSSEKNYIITADLGLFKYFDDIKNDIVEMYTFRNDILKFSKKYMHENNPNNEITVSIGFRRDDGGGASLILSLDYYYEAIKIIKNLFPEKNIKFFIFSGAPDDPSNGWKWIKENLKLDNIVYVEGLDKYHQMCLMTICDHNIISNSSFHWWGAYLNKNLNNKVICPHNYLNDKRFDYINGNWFPKEWNAIYTY